MSEVQTRKFACTACQKQYTWKEQLAGKTARCKCGHTMTVPASPPEPESEEGMYDFADDEPPVKAKPVSVKPAAAVAAAAATAAARTGVPLAYQRKPAAREKDRFSQDNLMQLNRDVYVPVGLLIVGLALYVCYYAVHFHLSGSGVGFTCIGLSFLTAFKAALLVGFALVVATPLGVSFGGLWTAVLKLAAIAVFCDGLTAWVDFGIAKISGGIGSGGLTSFGVIGFPIALGIYWLLLIYLFSMDPGDSWTVVMLLTVFDRIVRIVVLMLLLNLILGWSGASGGSSIPSFGSSKPAITDPLAIHVNDLQDSNALREAREYIADGHQAVLKSTVDDWYAKGCPNVWFEMSGADINGRREARGLILELPTDKSQRAKCFESLKKYNESNGFGSSPEDLRDDGKQYISVLMP